MTLEEFKNKKIYLYQKTEIDIQEILNQVINDEIDFDKEFADDSELIEYIYQLINYWGLIEPEIQIIDDLDKKKQKLIKEWKETYNSECFHCGALGIMCRGALKQESIDYCKENKLYDPVNNDMVEYSIEHLL